MTVIEYQGQQSMLPRGTTDEMLIEMFLHSKRSENTKSAYARDIHMFLECVGKSLVMVTLADLQTYQQQLAGEESSMNRRMAAIKSLLTFGNKTGYLQFNVGMFVKLEAAPSKLAARILNEEDVVRMIVLETNQRNHALFRLLYHCGVRVSEACAIQWADCVDRGDGTGQITILGKGHKQRTILVQSGMWEELLALKESLPAGASFHSPYVFVSQRGGKLTREQVFRLVRAAARRAGITQDVSPHWFRHAHASHSLDRGASIALVKSTLGHSSIAVTDGYSHARPNTSSGQFLSM